MAKNIKSTNILLLEDDPDQMAFFSGVLNDTIASTIQENNFSEHQINALKAIQLVKVTNLSSMVKTLKANQNISYAILDCNTPDRHGEQPHDQLIKTNHKITGQHRAVEIAIKYLPNVPITMISSMDRFRLIISRYYEKKHDQNVRFIRKRDLNKMKRVIERYVKKYTANI